MQCTECRFFDRHLKRIGDFLHGRFGQIRTQIDTRTGQHTLWPHTAQKQLGVGCSRFGTATVITDRAWIGTGRLWSNTIDPASINIGNGSTTGTDRVNIYHRDHRLVVADLGVQQVTHTQLALIRHPDVSRRTANVQGHGVVVTGFLTGPHTSDQTPDWPGHHE